jgi:hypothetical protein
MSASFASNRVAGDSGDDHFVLDGQIVDRLETPGEPPGFVVDWQIPEALEEAIRAVNSEYAAKPEVPRFRDPGWSDWLPGAMEEVRWWLMLRIGVALGFGIVLVTFLAK